MSRWPILRYLLSQHLVFLVLFVAGGCLLALLVLPVFLLFTPITMSAVDVGGQVLFWLAAGYGYGAAGLLATMVSHGRTRREFAWQYPVFQLVTAVVLAGLLTGVYAAEALLYRLAGWTRHLQDQRIFDAGDHLLIFVSYLCMLAICLATGAFVGTAFYRWEGGGVLALLPAAALLAYGGAMTGFFTLPFARLAISGAPTMLAVTVAAVAAGWALLWASVRDVSLRTRVAA
ncbi:hypothetical protein [Actinoplanes xinjiangensis]|uniref:Uncharacterized protein n=1 Tax=Actinoplanes xinjiangensis TaxID=512350 RepID=A0A316EVM7_9ACTN|nr:hypothetical protein [Actinoplanes xinjiangensis]PWK27256.1 hypothetical protein BC793_15519 [Actinoplanes xinjiangensis]GIF45311.1 hypothetical protein Axi01nite_96220 [Actinoplanes xinjiangensis]